MPDALLEQPYFAQAAGERVSTRCAMPVAALRLAGGKLPPGLRISGRGAIEGTPSVPGDFTFAVEVSDGCASRVEQRRVRVLPAPVLIVEAESVSFRCPLGAAAFPAGIVRVSGSAPGHPYRVEISGAGSAPVTWLTAVIQSGTLPADGMALEADTIRLTIDPKGLPAGIYTARLRTSMWRGANAPELHFRLQVDSPAAVLAPITSRPAPILARPSAVELPAVPIVAPPAPERAAPPRFPKYVPKPLVKTAPATGSGNRPGTARSRVLPFPKIVLPPRPPEPVKKEAPPERTKPSAMPPPSAEAGGGAKPKPAH